MAEATEHGAQKLLRRNGKAQSCEPCRKSKLRCDHRTPICGRCIRLQKQCFYHPAPLTKQNNDGVSGEPLTPTSLDRQQLLNSQSTPSERASLHSSASQSPHVSHAAITTPPEFPFGKRRRKNPTKYAPGFIGNTSHSAILDEVRGDLNSTNPAETNESPEAIEDADTTYRDRLGAAIFGRLPNEDLSHRLLDRFVEHTVAASLHLPTVKFFHETFWSTYGPYLREPRTSSGTMEAARLLNNKVAGNFLPSSFSTTRDYLIALSNRWEMVGVLFTCWAALVIMLRLSDPLMREFIPKGSDCKDMSFQLVEAARGCLEIVDQLDSGLNAMVMFLSYRCAGIQSYASNSGDTSFDLWMRVSKLCSTSTALGFHRISDVDLRAPGSLLYQEQQKRIFVIAFAQDKEYSIFLGRPPHLSKRYVTAPPLLDASEEAIMDDDVEAIKRNLNEYGYNKEGKIYSSTSLRAFYASSLVYEDILEVSLGKAPPEVSRLRTIKEAAERGHSCLPHMYHEKINRSFMQKVTIFESTAVVEMQLVHLHQLFLIARIEHADARERLVQLQQQHQREVQAPPQQLLDPSAMAPASTSSSTSTSGITLETLDIYQTHLLDAADRLIDAAEQMLEIVLCFWNERDNYPGHTDDVHWALSCYGIPAASALSIGLWKATETTNSNTTYRPPSNRSRTIQKLSLFVACLDWVMPKNGHYALCQRTRGLLKDILDRVLTPQNPDVVQQLPTPDFTTWDIGDFSLAGLPNFGAGGPMGFEWDMCGEELFNVPRMNFN